MQVINVGLYGGKGLFGGKETPLEASVIRCDKFENCSYYKNGHCLLVRSFGSTGCKFGSAGTVRGYTSRAKKYGEFKRQWKDHESYGKLSHPPTKLGLIDDCVVFPYPYVRITKTENGVWKIDDPSFLNNSKAYIPLCEFTSEFIYRICRFRPQAMMGGTITSYQKETVPTFLAHLKEVLPEKYKEFTTTYPEYGEKEINYVGRTALLKTINPSEVHYKSKNYPKFNNTWHWDGEVLTYKYGYVHSFDITNDYEIAEITIRPSDNSTIKIAENNQVNENTVFVD